MKTLYIRTNGKSLDINISFPLFLSLRTPSSQITSSATVIQDAYLYLARQVVTIFIFVEDSLERWFGLLNTCIFIMRPYFN